MNRRGVSFLAVITLSLVATVIPAILIRESAALGSPGLPDTTRTLESLPLNNTSGEMFTWEIIDLRHALMAAIDPFFTRSSDVDWRLSREQIAAAAKIPVAGVSITGPTSGQTGDRLAFIAIVTPLDASPPVKYTWSPAPIDGQRRQIATFSWTTPGWKLINVTAYNKTGSASGSHRVFISSGSITPVQEVDIINPESVYLNETDALTATFSPNNATWPIDFLWLPTPDSGNHTPHAAYTWRSMGDISITVIASNTEDSPPASHTHYLTVRSIGLSDVWISGPSTATVNQPALFTAVISPARATTPITHHWSPEPDNGQSSPVATYVFTRPGDVTITVRAENIGGSKESPPHNVHVENGGPVSVYLPIALRRWPPIPPPPLPEPILNPEGRNDYTVTWGSADLAEIYFLEEATDVAFISGEVIYSGTQTYHHVTGNSPSRYYYRVKACNALRCSELAYFPPPPVDVLSELEPNTYIYQANGPLVSGIDYFGHPDVLSPENPDPWDCFYIDTNRTGQIIVDLFDHAGGDPQLLLYQLAYSDMKARDYDWPYHIDYTGPADRYYVCIYSVGGDSTQRYTLRLTFP